MKKVKKELETTDLKNYKHGKPKAVSFKFKGFRDVIYCPLANEPTFLKYSEDGEPFCDACDGNWEAVSHPFICHIDKRFAFK